MKKILYLGLVILFSLFFISKLNIYSDVNKTADAKINTTKNIISKIKLNNIEPLRIIQISDVQIDSKGGNSRGRLYKDAPILFEDAVKEINKIKNIDAIVFSGDLSNRARVEELSQFANIATKLIYPWFCSTGNHDIGVGGGVSKKEFVEILTSKNKYMTNDKPYYYVIPKEGYILIFMDGSIDKMISANGFFPDDEIDWLDKTLTEHNDKIAIITQHFPLVEPFPSISHTALNKSEYIRVLNKHKNVVAILSGHYHGTKLTVADNIAHISTPALVEYPNAYRELTITPMKDKIQITSKIHETTLKKLQTESKNNCRSYKLHAGQPEDRNFTIFLNK